MGRTGTWGEGECGEILVMSDEGPVVMWDGDGQGVIWVVVMKVASRGGIGPDGI